MTHSAFNSDQLKEKLSGFPATKQAAFGASCCLRLVPNYVFFRHQTGWRDEKPLVDALSLIWGWAEGGEVGNPRELTERCEALAPRSENFDTHLSTAAQDACFAVCAVLDFIGSGGADTDRIVQAASYARDSVDLFVQEEEGMDSTDPELEQKILHHPLMHAELAAQESDLAELGRSDDLSSFRKHCETSAKSNLGLS
jgi:uncharacterized protein YjaG (DUF416 family)